jgi:hypothetical protein
VMLSGDEFYGDDVTGAHITEGRAHYVFTLGQPIPVDLEERANAALEAGTADVSFGDCAWCEDWGMGMDPEPCAKHSVTRVCGHEQHDDCWCAA